MSEYKYSKYRISINEGSSKTQGLKCGDIVRRQYSDGARNVYSLMCVLDSGVNYFVGALIEGDVPNSKDILDFSRLTNLFDEDRGGALYLTASDDQAPYMDVLDGIAKNKTLCYPTGVHNTGLVNPTLQYTIDGKSYVTASYIKSEADNKRICKLVRNSSVAPANTFIGIKQEFEGYVANPNRVLISYKIKSSKPLSNIPVSLGYSDGTRSDGGLITTSSTEWGYRFHAITVDNSGRYKRTVSINVNDNLASTDWVAISDLNIILLSSISNFNETSQTRIGKMDGVTDDVFGRLRGYGGYLQRLYASNSVNISGTLTAGDENGFASTFYAGKIHKNVLINSLSPNLTNKTIVDVSLPANQKYKSPTGIGDVAKITSQSILTVQTSEWLLKHVGIKYTLSFWAYVEDKTDIFISQNDTSVGVVSIDISETHVWKRHDVEFELFPAKKNTDDLAISFTFNGLEIYVSSPQFEKGSSATQYQPTDDVLSETEDYGAWMSRGGIGGTIQNPLLKLNYDGNGAIGSSNGSFLLNKDGSGKFANGNIVWNSLGDVTFGKNVQINWDNFTQDAQNNLLPRSIKITGPDVFTFNNTDYAPTSITLSLTENNITSNNTNRQWSYMSGSSWTNFDAGNGSTLTVLPEEVYWRDKDALTVKCCVSLNQSDYIDTITIKKQFNAGYTMTVTSVGGEAFINGKCNTTLTANLYYNGTPVLFENVAQKFTFWWRKYHLGTGGVFVEDDFYQEGTEIHINEQLNGYVKYDCQMELKYSCFPYSFSFGF